MDDRILVSVKKLIGVPEESTDFDLDILMNINAAIVTLSQIGVGPSDPFTVTGNEETYSDFLGENFKGIALVKMYLVYKTQLGFDPPASGSVSSSLEKKIAETEWRLSVMVDPVETFEEEIGVGVDA